MMIFLPVNKKKALYLLRKYPDVVKRECDVDGRGYTSVYIIEDQIEKAWSLKEIDQSLPWRYRSTPIKIRLFPTPKGWPVDTLSATLSTTTYRAIRDRVAVQFGGRCQVCGHARTNKKGRRISPMIYTNWLHTPHPNRKKKLGIREILGIASVCDDCLNPLTLANPTPCGHIADIQQRKLEIQKSLHRFALHNQLSRSATMAIVKKAISDRVSHLDSVNWVLNLRWLSEKKLVAPESIVLNCQHVRRGYTVNKEGVVVPPASRRSGHHHSARYHNAHWKPGSVGSHGGGGRGDSRGEGGKTAVA